MPNSCWASHEQCERVTDVCWSCTWSAIISGQRVWPHVRSLYSLEGLLGVCYVLTPGAQAHIFLQIAKLRLWRQLIFHFLLNHGWNWCSLQLSWSLTHGFFFLQVFPGNLHFFQVKAHMSSWFTITWPGAEVDLVDARTCTLQPGSCFPYDFYSERLIWE